MPELESFCCWQQLWFSLISVFSGRITFLPDHYDNVAIGNFSGDTAIDPVAGLAASSAGFYLIDALTGATLAWHRIGHAQFIVPCRMRTDIPGMQLIVANHHGSNRLVSLFTGRGEFIWSIHPNFHVLENPIVVTWPGAEAQLLWVHTVDSGQSLYDGFGRCVKRLPQVAETIGDWPRRHLNAQAVRLGTDPKQMLAFTANGRLYVFGPK